MEIQREETTKKCGTKIGLKKNIRAEAERIKEKMEEQSRIKRYSIISINTRGTIKNYNRIIEEIKDAKIVLLQEQYIDPKQIYLKKMEKDTGSKAFYTTDKRNGRSIVTLIKKDLLENVESTTTEIEGRVLGINIKIKQKLIAIWNVYAPAAEKERLAFFKELFKKTTEKKNLILGGEFNITLNKNETNGEFIKKTYMAFVEERLNRQNLKDVHNSMSRDNIKFTFTASNNKVRKRLDKFIYSGSLQNRLVDYCIKPNTFSDHDGIYLEIDMNQRVKWGKGVWKMNNEILKEEKYIEYMKEVIWDMKDCKNKENLEPGEWWEKLKAKIKKESVGYCRNRSISKTKERKILEKEVHGLQEKIDSNVNKVENEGKITQAKKKLKEIIESDCRGARIRSRVEEIEKDEKSTKFFFSKEHNNGERKQIRSLLKGVEVIQDQDRIMGEIETFYGKLYKAEGVEEECIEKMCKNVKGKISNEDRKALNKFITKEEIKEALHSMKNNKSPGEDGISKEFFLTFENEIMEELCEMLNNILFKGKMPESLRNAIITLLFKKNDHRMLKNWRPISLLNTDYKILSKILAMRLRKVISSLLPVNKKCGAPKRQMSEILLAVDSICEFSEEENIGGAIICVDQEKAFDRVSHQYLFKILQEMGFDGNFLKFIKAMYNEISCQVNVNGKLSDKIKVNRSVRQGCSISMLLFVLSASPIINMIEGNKEIEGMKTKSGKEIKIMSYADDTTLVVRSEKSIDVIFKQYDIYARASEAKINREKTEILRLGKWRKQMPKEEKYKEYVKREIKILGATFHEERKENEVVNWKKKEEKALKIIKYHEKREISLFGKILLINSLVLSQYWHIGTILPPNEKYIRRLYRMINDWLNGRNGNYIIGEIMKSKEEGGAGLIDLRKRLEAIKIKSLQFLITGNYNKEQDILLYWAGTRTMALGNFKLKGPKCENCTNYHNITFSTMLKHKEKLKGIAEMNTKQIQNVIYNPEKNKKIEYSNIYQGKDSKLKSLNFRIATNTLKTAVNRDDTNRACVFCKNRHETTYHLFLECEVLKFMREELIEYANTVREVEENINWNYIINMKNLECEIEYEIISLYKKIIWLQAVNMRFDNAQFNKEAMKSKYACDLQFYVKYIYREPD